VKPVVFFDGMVARGTTFSILERIDVGETKKSGEKGKEAKGFQYPRTDRRG